MPDIELDTRKYQTAREIINSLPLINSISVWILIIKRYTVASVRIYRINIVDFITKRASRLICRLRDYYYVNMFYENCGRIRFKTYVCVSIRKRKRKGKKWMKQNGESAGRKENCSKFSWLVINVPIPLNFFKSCKFERDETMTKNICIKILKFSFAEKRKFDIV